MPRMIVPCWTPLERAALWNKKAKTVIYTSTVEY